MTTQEHRRQTTPSRIFNNLRGLIGSFHADYVIRMVNIEGKFDIHTEWHGEVKERKAGVFKSKFKSPGLALQSKQKAIKEKHAECLTGLVRFKRKSEEMENLHTQAIATIQERHRVAQENYNAAQEKYRAKIAKTTAHNANMNYEFSRGTQNIENDQQRGKMNVLVFITQVILYVCGIAAVRTIRHIKRKFLRQ